MKFEEFDAGSSCLLVTIPAGTFADADADKGASSRDNRSFGQLLKGVLYAART
jgi:hypothetical protein